MKEYKLKFCSFKLKLEQPFEQNGNLQRETYNLCTGYSFSTEKYEILKNFLQIQGVISRTTEPILGLFVLVSMHFYAQLKYNTEKLNFNNFLKSLI